jgi:hypothetical protein
MKFLSAFFAGLFAADILYAADMVPGGNLTSFGNQQGAADNNQYNQLMNPGRTAGGGAQADFGNCNALIQRCATPKCGNGGCTDMNVATPIVAGCVAASAECKKHGDALVQAIAAQLVASNTQKANAQAQQMAAQQAAAAQAQSAQQLEQMNQQMQQMQQQMAAQQAESAEQMQQALAQQQQATQAALAQQAELAAQQAAASAPAASMQTAVDRGVSADAIAREQIAGQVMSSLDGVDAGLKSLKQTVQDVIEYAKCDYNANSCAGPRRVAAFRKKAQAFFEPYDGVLDSLENSLYTAMAAGIDVSDIYMMLSNTCTQWGKYLCTYKNDNPFVYCANSTYEPPTMDDPVNKGNKIYADGSNTCRTYEWSNAVGTAGQDGYTANNVKKVVNPRCQFIEMYRNDQRDEIQQNYILANSNDATNIRMACMSDGVLQTGIFGRRNRKKSNDFDIDALEIIINQEEMRNPPEKATEIELTKYCKLSEEDKTSLEQSIKTKKYKNLLGDFSTPAGEFNKNRSKCLDDDEGDCYANPIYAMCSIHAYNIGKIKNEADNVTKMNEAIALKSTVIAQQLKKQYDYLASMVKQIKTQMQKSVMAAKAEAAGAGSSSSSGSNSNVISCSGYDQQETISCLRRNHQSISRSLASKASIDAATKNQLESDRKSLNSILLAYSGSTDIKENLEADCDRNRLSSKSGVEQCLSTINAGFIFVDNELKKINNPSLRITQQ